MKINTPDFNANYNIPDPIPRIMRKLTLDETHHIHILDRAREIGEERHAQESKALSSPPPLSKTFWGSVWQGMGSLLNIWPNTDYQKQVDLYAKFPKAPSWDEARSRILDNLRYAIAEYIIDSNTPLDTFTEDERSYIFPSGIPVTPDNTPQL